MIYTSFVTNLGSQSLIGQNFTIQSVPAFLATALGWGLVIGAVIVFGCIVISGFQLATAGNEPSKAKSAKDNITNCIFGFGILSSTWAIALVVQFFLGIEIFQTPDSAPTAGMCIPEGSWCNGSTPCCGEGMICYESGLCGAETSSCECNNPLFPDPMCAVYPYWFPSYELGTGSCPNVEGNPRTCVCVPDSFVAPTSTPTPNPLATNTPTPGVANLCDVSCSSTETSTCRENMPPGWPNSAPPWDAYRYRPLGDAYCMYTYSLPYCFCVGSGVTIPPPPPTNTPVPPTNTPTPRPTSTPTPTPIYSENDLFNLCINCISEGYDFNNTYICVNGGAPQCVDGTTNPPNCYKCFPN